MRISVVVPTLNEASNVSALLAHPEFARDEVEVIIVDGGSRDRTVAMATDRGASVLHAPKGRGAQLRAGAEAASGDVIVLLHADTRLGEGALQAVKDAMKDPRVVGGNFRLEFDGDSRFARWTTRFYAWLRRRGVYYGDSAIFVRADVLKDLGGVPAIEIMEDFALVSKLQRAGPTVCVETPPARTSSRRFEGRSGAMIVFGWIKIHLLYWLGVSPQRLATLYRSEEQRPGVKTKTAPRITGGDTRP
ncbi:MAG: TIGR04283 family arsenosugar biosynthesis glycosyltransferase [Pseudomonadota bacterium]